MFEKVTPQMVEVLKRSASSDTQVAQAARVELARALEVPLRKGIMQGDNHSWIFENTVFEPGTHIEYPIHFMTPSNVREFRAYTIPNQGMIPHRYIESDYLSVPTYTVGASIDWTLRYARDARWDIVSQALQVMEGQFVVKDNQDAWRLLLAAAAGRNVVQFDSTATPGYFSKRLISLMQVSMRRTSGGNFQSMGQGKLTDVAISPEGLMDIRNWGVTEIDEVTRREIFIQGDGEESVNRIYGVQLHALDEFGETAEYTNYYKDVLGATIPGSKLEIVLGMDLLNRDSFMNPVRSPLEIYEDLTRHRSREMGFYGWKEHGWAVLTNWRLLLGAF